MVAIPGINLGSTAVPYDTADTFPIQDEQYGLGGYRTVNNNTDRNAIPFTRCKQGMLVYSITSATTYRLKFGFSNPTVDGDWEAVEVPTTAALNYYVATTGNDGNQGLAIGDPFLTIQHALDVIATNRLSGLVTINVADGTYNESLFMPSIIGNEQSTTYGNSVVKILGNITTPANVVINSTGDVVTLFDSSIYYILDGITIQGDGLAASRGIRVSAGFLGIRNLNMTNVGTALSASDSANIVFEDTPNGGTYSVTGSFVSAAANTVVVVSKDNLVVTGITGFGFSIGNHSQVSFGNITAISLTANATPGSGVAAFQCSLSGFITNPTGATINVANFSETNSGAAFRLINGGTVQLGAGNTINITDCNYGGILFTGAKYLETGITTYNYLGTTPAKWLYDETSFWYSSNTFGATTLTNQTSTNIGMGMDRRSVDRLFFNHVGALPVATDAYFTANGLNSTIVPLYLALRDEVITSVNVLTDANGAGQTDTYTLYVAGAPTALVTTVTNSTAGSTTMDIALSAGQSVAMKINTSAATTGGNVLVQITRRIA